MMDLAKLKTAIETAHQEMNTVLDGVVRTRSAKGLRALIVASNHLSSAGKHIEKAETQASKAS